MKLINKNSSKLKILGTGEIKSKINIEADLVPKSAVEKLEKIGGSIQLKNSSYNYIKMSTSSSSNDLRNRIIFTIAILAVYRFGTFVPLPGIDPEQLKIMMEGNQKGLLGMFNVFAGGAVSRMAIFALGIMPYISSSIIVQLLTGVSDYFKNLKSQEKLVDQRSPK